MADSLADRLRTAIDAEEARAHALPPFPWRVFPDGDDQVLAADDLPVAEAFALSSNQQRLVAEHIARHDPAAVLRRCAADRKILDLHATALAWYEGNQGVDPDPSEVNTLCTVVEALAEAYGVEA